MLVSKQIFEKNLNHIKIKNPELASMIENLSKNPLEYKIINGQSTTISFKGLQLSSRNDPIKEAQQQANCLNESTVITIYGVGLGYLQTEILKKKEVRQLNIKVMNLHLFCVVLSMRDHSNWLNDKRVTISRASTDNDIFMSSFTHPPELLMADNNSERIRNRLSSKIIDNIVERDFSVENTFLVNRIQENCRNLKKDNHINTIKGLGKSKKAIVIGSGASLASNISQLKSVYKLKHRPLIISVATTTKYLVNSGIKPDFVVIVDKDIELTHPLLSDFSLLKNSSLVYFPFVRPDVIQAWQGRKYAAYSDGLIFKEIKKKFPHGALFSGGSVIHPATDLAVWLGCNDITFFGVDFSYVTEQTHVGWSGASLPNYLGIGPKDARNRSIINGYGQLVKTVDNFIGYLVELERYIESHPDINFWNSSHLGAVISGCKYKEDFK
jgi:hypothetical protein